MTNTLLMAQWGVSLGLLLLILVLWLRIGRGKPAPFAYLYRLEGKKLVKYAVMTEICRIGRHPNNELRLNNKSVSRFHAELVRNKNGSFSVFDADSRNGIKVGSRPVRSNLLREGDLVDIGGIRLKFTRYPRDFNVHRNTEMMEVANTRFAQHRRRGGRSDVIMQVRVYNEDSGWISGQLRDVGADGAFIRIKEQISPRSPVDIVFPIVDGRYRRWLRLSGEVTRHDAEGIGISFTDNDPIARQLLNDASRKEAA